MRQYLWIIVFLSYFSHVLCASQIVVIIPDTCNSSPYVLLACQGVQVMQAKYPADVIYHEQVSVADCENMWPAKASSHKLIILLSFNFEACSLKIAAAANQSWLAIIDACPTGANQYANFICATFAEEQPSYVAGYLAGLISNTNVTGVVGGIPVPAVQRLFNGFLVGVKTSCPHCQIEGMYVNSFVNPANANDTARYLVTQLKADVVFGCGGGTGSEAIKIAAGLGAYAIGVDSDEIDSTFLNVPMNLKSRLATSALKKVDVAVQTLIAMFRLPSVGQKVQGLSGNSLVFDYTNGGVGVADCHFSCAGIGVARWNAMKKVENELSANVLSVPLVGLGWSVPLTPASISKNTFYPAPPHAKPPNPRIHSAMTSFNAWLVDFIVIFGGKDLYTTYNDLWLYNIQSAKWLNGVHGITDGTQPPGLAKACAVPLGSQSVFIFGGRTSSGSQSNDVYSYVYQPTFLGFGDPTSPKIRNTWRKLNSTGDVPVAVEGPSCAQLNSSCGILFGGRALLEYLNTVHMFCTSNDVVHWVLVHPTGNQQSGASTPEVRERAGVAVIDGSTVDATWPSGKSLIVAGGNSKGTWKSDVWLLSLDSSAGWMSLPNLPRVHRSSPLATISSSGGSGGNVLVLQPTSAPLDAFTYDPGKGVWNMQNTGFANGLDDFIAVEQAVMGTSAGGVGISPQMWLFGGTVNGTYQNRLGVSSFAVQTVCLPGEKAQGVGCEACGPGMYSGGGIGASCVLCDPGKYSSVNITSNCSDCPAGRYGSSMGQHVCPLCVQGRYKSIGFSPCDLCPTGTYGAISGATVFTDCVTCPAGRYTQGVLGLSNQSDCIACPAGSALENPFGKAVCKPCAPGMFSQSGQAVCSRCPLGQYQPNASQSTCLSCDAVLPGSTTDFMAALSATDCVCPAGYYRPNGAGIGLRCQVCPEGMFCKIGSDMRTYTIVKAQGFPASLNSWLFPVLKERYWSHADNPLHVYACENEHYCPGGPPGTCVANAEGIACARCANEYFPTGTSCSKCTDVEMTNVLFPLMPLVLAHVIVWFMYYRFQDTPPKWGSWQNGIAALLFIKLNFFQIVSMVTSAKVVLPKTVDQTYTVWASSQDVISLFKIGCTGIRGFQGRMVAQSLVPIALFFVCLMSLVLSRIFSQVLERVEAMHMDRLFNVYLSLIQAFFLGIVNLSCALFKCQSNPNKESTLASDRSIICYSSGQWQSMIGVAIAAILLYCGGSICLFSWAISVAPRKFSDPVFQKRWKFLFIKFRMDVHWWGLIILLKGVVLNLGFVFLTSSAGQLYWMMLSVMAYIFFVAIKMPWRHWSANLMDILVHLCAVSIISMMAWFVDDSSASLDRGIASTVVVATCIPFWFFLTLVLHLWLSDRRHHLMYQGRNCNDFIDSFDYVMQCFAAKSTDEKKHIFAALDHSDMHVVKSAIFSLHAEIHGYDRHRLVAGHKSKLFTDRDKSLKNIGPDKFDVHVSHSEHETNEVPKLAIPSPNASSVPVFSVQEELAMAELQWTPREKLMESPREKLVVDPHLVSTLVQVTTPRSNVNAITPRMAMAGIGQQLVSTVIQVATPRSNVNTTTPRPYSNTPRDFTTSPRSP